jgi:uncharacterized membrane protein
LSLLIAGVVLFAAMHLFPAIAEAARDRLAGRLGSGPYRGLFSLLIAGSIAMIVTGWKSAAPAAVYAPVMSAGATTSLLVLSAFVLFAASILPTNIRRLLRNPQLTGVVLWSLAHLLANGDSRSLVLFGGIGLWAIAEILVCNHRDGAWLKPARTGIRSDAIVVLLGAAVFAAMFYVHVVLFGVPAGPSS